MLIRRTYQVVVGIGIWPVAYAVGAETSSLRLRAKTQGKLDLTAEIRCYDCYEQLTKQLGIGWFCGAFAQGAFG